MSRARSRLPGSNAARKPWKWPVLVSAAYLTSLAQFGERLDPALVAIDDLPEKARQTLQMIEGRRTQRPVLLIFDNLPSAADLKGRTPARGAHVLITSRAALWGGGVKALTIGLLSPEEAVRLLISRSGVNDPAGAATLAETLGHLPLALEQAAATIAAEGLTFADYAHNLQTFLDQVEDSSDYPKSVAATVREALASAMTREPLVEQAMQILSLLAPNHAALSESGGLDLTGHNRLRWMAVQIGDAYAALGLSALARQAQLRGLHHAEALLTSDPSNVGFQRGLGASCDRLGNLAQAAGDAVAAQGWFQRDFDIAEALVKADPGNVEFQRDLIVSLVRTAVMGVDPVAQYQRALQISLDLQSSGRLAPGDAYFVESLRDLLAEAQGGA